MPDEPTALEVRLRVVDMEQLTGAGYRINPRNTEPERSELVGKVLQEGQCTTIYYPTDAGEVGVVYAVSGLQPPYACVDSRTVVVIEGVREKPHLASRSLAAHLGGGISMRDLVRNPKMSGESYNSGSGNYSLNVIPRTQEAGSTLEIRRAVRSQMRARLNDLLVDISHFRNEGLDLSNLVAEAEGLEESLRDFW